MNWNTEGLAAFPYPVSAKSHAWQEHPELTPEAAREFGKLCIQVYEKGKNPDHDLRRALQRWPEQPAFHLLAAEIAPVAQQARILEDMARDFPDTIYGNIAAGLIGLRTYYGTHSTDLPAILPALDKIHPGRTSYPAMEVYLYELVATQVQVLHDKFMEAGERAKRVTRMAQKHTNAKMFAEVIRYNTELERSFEFATKHKHSPWEAHYLADYQRALVPQLKAIQTRKPTPLRLAATWELWNRQFFYDTDFTDRLLIADRGDLIHDLSTILQDSIRLYEFCWQTSRYNDAPIQALLYLCHLRSVEAMPQIMDFIGSFDMNASPP